MPYARHYDGPAFATDFAVLWRDQLAASGLRSGQLCLCVTDTAWSPAYAAACAGATRMLGAEACQLVLPWDRPPHDASLAAICREADLIVYATALTLHYHRALRGALAAGRRALCVMQPPHALERLRFDPDVRARAVVGAAALGAARTVRIASPAGTELSMTIAGRPALANYGAADAPGRLDFWGCGMVQVAQVEGTTEGRVVLDVGDCCFMLGRFVESPVVIDVRAGRIECISGGLDARLIRAALEAAGDAAAFCAGHIAFGVDHRAQWLQPILQTPDAGGGGGDSESFHGVVQVEFGSNDDLAFGGRNRSRAHLGLCLRGASLWADDRPLVEAGGLVTPPAHAPPPASGG